MNILTDGELAAVHHCVDVRKEQLAAIGLELHADGDLNNWVRHMEQAPGILEVAANLDPARSNLHPGNAYWIYATNEHGPSARVYTTSSSKNTLTSGSKSL